MNQPRAQRRTTYDLSFIDQCFLPRTAQMPIDTASVIIAYTARVQEARVWANRGPMLGTATSLKSTIYDPFPALILPECPPLL